MSHFYAQIDSDSRVIAVSDLSGVIKPSHPMYDSMIPLREYNTNLLPSQSAGQLLIHKYTERDDDGYGVFETITEEIPEPIDPEPTQDEINAQILLNQCEIMANQESQDEVLAEILLNGITV